MVCKAGIDILLLFFYIIIIIIIIIITIIIIINNVIFAKGTQMWEYPIDEQNNPQQQMRRMWRFEAARLGNALSAVEAWW